MKKPTTIQEAKVYAMVKDADSKDFKAKSPVYVTGLVVGGLITMTLLGADSSQLANLAITAIPLLQQFLVK